MRELFSYIQKHFGKLDFAINNASPTITSLGEFRSISTELLRSTLETDFWAFVLCLKHELNLINSGGCIVNISSVNGLRPNPGGSMYSSAKHGVEGLTRSIALEALEYGVRVNAVAPGVTWTERWESRQKDNPEVKSEVEAVVPIKRFANPSEIVNAIEWLCSSSSSYVVGHTLVVDGGLSLS